MTLMRLLAVLCSTDRAAAFLVCAAANCGIPFMSKVTLPCHSLGAASHVVGCSAWVLVTELSSNSREPGSKGIVRTDSFVGTVRTACAIGAVTVLDTRAKSMTCSSLCQQYASQLQLELACIFWVLLHDSQKTAVCQHVASAAGGKNTAQLMGFHLICSKRLLLKAIDTHCSCCQYYLYR